MFLNEPGRTNYDLSFNLFGFDVRIHPGFFVLPFIFGAQFAQGMDRLNPGVIILTFTLVFFVSILIHELGHSLTLRYFGVPSRIVLYWFGGLAIHDVGWGGGRRLTSNQQILVSLAGPFAGFLLVGVFAAGVLMMGGELEAAMDGMFPMLFPNFTDTPFVENYAIILFFYVGLFCNIFWNILNLAPVFPLDGGQVSREVFVQLDYQDGVRKSLMLAVAAAAVIAVVGFSSGDSFMAIFFAFMGYSNFIALQQMSGRGGGVW